MLNCTQMPEGPALAYLQAMLAPRWSPTQVQSTSSLGATTSWMPPVSQLTQEQVFNDYSTW